MHSPALSKQLALAALSGTFPLESKLQKEFAQKVPNSIFKQFLDAGDSIQNDDPKSVMSIIEKVVFRVRNKNLHKDINNE